MKIEKVKVGYSTSIPIAAYGIKDNAWAEVEVNLEGESLDYEKLFSALKDEVDEAVRKKYPHLYANDEWNSKYVEAMSEVARQSPIISEPQVGITEESIN